MGIIPDKYISDLQHRLRKKRANYTGTKVEGLLALSPLAVFLAVYLISALIAGDFYKIPISAAFLIASVWAIVICRGNVEERIAIFSSGAGEKNVMLMIWLFIMAGAFAQTAKEIGAAQETVDIMLRILPSQFIYAGLFLAACFVSMAMGTSVGTIVALVPIAAGMAGETGCGVPFITAIVVGGAFFGDNLSFISDTTIAATRTQSCTMSDKFKANLGIVAPAALIVTVIYVFMGGPVDFTPERTQVNWILLLPYLSIIVLSVCGMNVTAVLFCGLAINALIGLSCGSLTWSGYLCAIGKGISGMGDLITVTMLAGGLLEVIRHNGGLDFIVRTLTRHIRGKRGAELSIAALVSFANFCTANNTIAIISTGRIARELTEKYNLDPRKSASILDTFSCLVQSIIPYGAQLLMASGLAGISPVSVISRLYYPLALGVISIAAILLRYPRKYS